MQCTCCHAESDNLREYSISAVDERNRKTIQTFNLCPICRIVYLIKPLHVSARTRAMPVRSAPRAA